MDALFAQVNKGGAPVGAGPGAAFFLTLICVCGLVGAIGLTIRILFLLSMSRCFKEISPENRKMEPGQVWLALIPLFDIVWMIIMMLRLSESLDLEYEDRDLPPDGDFGKTLAIVYIVSAFVCGIVTPVIFIMYWVKVASYTRTLRENPGSGRDEYDREPPRRRRSRDDDDDDRPARGDW